MAAFSNGKEKGSNLTEHLTGKTNHLLIAHCSRLSRQLKSRRLILATNTRQDPISLEETYQELNS